MDGQYSWKRTQDIEIDLLDLLHSLCMQWRRIVVCALTAAVIFGGYGWMKGRNRPDVQEAGSAQQTVLSESDEQAAASAVILENEIRGLEEYLNHSVLMKLDPYHKDKSVMLYSIEHAERENLQKITESYLNFLLNGGAADVLKKTGGSEWQMEKRYAAELISAYQKNYSSSYQVITDDMIKPESLFYVEVTGENAGTVEKMALMMQSVLEDYSAQIRKSVGSHKLVLVNSVESTTCDSALQSQQHEKKMLLSSNRSNLKAQTDAFTQEQMAVYMAAAGLEEGEGISAEAVKEGRTDTNTVAFVMRFIIIGLAGGVFAYCAVFSCRYIFRDTVKTAKEMKERYVFPYYGEILPEDGSRERNRSAYERGKAKVLNRIRLSCEKKGLKSLCAAADFSLSIQEKGCLDSMAEQLKGWGIQMLSVENVMTDTSGWKSLLESGNVLMLCRLGETTHGMIDDSMRFYLENGITVAGAAAFLKMDK